VVKSGRYGHGRRSFRRGYYSAISRGPAAGKGRRHNDSGMGLTSKRLAYPGGQLSAGGAVLMRWNGLLQPHLTTEGYPGRLEATTASEEKEAAPDTFRGPHVEAKAGGVIRRLDGDVELYSRGRGPGRGSVDVDLSENCAAQPLRIVEVGPASAPFAALGVKEEESARFVTGSFGEIAAHELLQGSSLNFSKRGLNAANRAA